MLRRRDFVKGWQPTIMINNRELIDPYDGVDASTIRAARAARRLTALDEGVAYRSKLRQLLVLRTEVFFDPDETAHRTAWQADGLSVLTSTYQTRWAERDVTPNWIETRLRPATDLPGELDPRVDWLQVEDHTDPKRSGTVTLYEHVTLWCGRSHAVVTVRHEYDQQVEGMAIEIAHRLLDRLTSFPAGGGAPLGGS